MAASPWVEKNGGFFFCHAERTTDTDGAARAKFNFEYDAMLRKFGFRHKCLQCDCDIGPECTHNLCEKTPKCKQVKPPADRDGCSLVAAHIYFREDGKMYLGRTCKSCNSGGGCVKMNAEKKDKKFRIWDLKKPVSEYPRDDVDMGDQ